MLLELDFAALSLIGESVRCIARGEIKLCQEPCNIHDEVNKGLSLSVLQIHVYGISLGHARELRRMSLWITSFKARSILA